MTVRTARTWEAESDPIALARVVTVRRRRNPRRSALFAVGAFRASGAYDSAPGTVRAVVDEVEAVADLPRQTDAEWRARRDRHRATIERYKRSQGAGLRWVAWYALHMPDHVSSVVGNWLCNLPHGGPERTDAEATICRLFRCVWANPFRETTLKAEWLSRNVVDLARTIYAERAFERMPILADALMDEGCDDEAVLAHCRAGPPHGRGCWVVDAILGKT